MHKQNACGRAEGRGRPIRTQGGADSGYRLEPFINRLYVALMLRGKTHWHSTTTWEEQMLTCSEHVPHMFHLNRKAMLSDIREKEGLQLKWVPLVYSIKPHLKGELCIQHLILRVCFRGCCWLTLSVIYVQFHLKFPTVPCLIYHIWHFGQEHWQRVDCIWPCEPSDQILM